MKLLKSLILALGVGASRSVGAATLPAPKIEVDEKFKISHEQKFDSLAPIQISAEDRASLDANWREFCSKQDSEWRAEAMRRRQEYLARKRG